MRSGSVVVGIVLSLAIVEVTAAREGVQHGGAEDTEAVFSQQDVDFNLGRLAELERELGNGGSDDPVPITAGWDSRNGFHIRDAENLFLLKIGARAQIRYTYKGRDKRGDTVDAGEAGTSDESHFELERMRLQLSGHVVDPRLQYVFQWDSDTDNSGGMVLLDGLVSYEVVEDKLSVGAGQYKAHFLRQEVNSSSSLQMVERSLSNEFFNIDRVIGIYAEGNPTEQTYYSIGVNNGFRSVNRSIGAGIDHIPAVVGKFDVVLLGAWEKYSEGDLKRRDDPYLSLGVSGAADANNETDGAADPQYKTYQFGLDAVFQYMGFSLFGEYVGRWLDYEANAGATDPDIITGSSTYAHGFNLQGGLMLTESLEATARCSVVYGNEGANDGTAIEAGPGFNWFINGHKVKLQSDVMFFDIPASMPRASTNLQRSDPLDPPEFSSSAAGYDAGEQGVMWRTQFQLSF